MIRVKEINKIVNHYIIVRYQLVSSNWVVCPFPQQFFLSNLKKLPYKDPPRWMAILHRLSLHRIYTSSTTFCISTVKLGLSGRFTSPLDDKNSWEEIDCKVSTSRMNYLEPCPAPAVWPSLPGLWSTSSEVSSTIESCVKKKETICSRSCTLFAESVGLISSIVGAMLRYASSWSCRSKQGCCTSFCCRRGD